MLLPPTVRPPIVYDRRVDWKFINTFAPWFSALGSLAAVITALYLARTERTVDLKITAGVRVVAAPPQNPEKCVYVEVVNRGRRRAIVDSILWRLPRPFSEYEYVWIPSANSLSERIPATLEDGQRARFIGPLEGFTANFLEVVGTGWTRRIKARLLRVAVTTSTGRRFERRIEKGLRKALTK
jgi:hypothetical protein